MGRGARRRAKNRNKKAVSLWVTRTQKQNADATRKWQKTQGLAQSIGLHAWSSARTAQISGRFTPLLVFSFTNRNRVPGPRVGGPQVTAVVLVVRPRLPASSRNAANPQSACGAAVQAQGTDEWNPADQGAALGLDQMGLLRIADRHDTA
eukprot:2452363-Prymnesium_polylepis.2